MVESTLRQKLKNAKFYQYDLISLIFSIYSAMQSKSRMTGEELQDLLSRLEVDLPPEECEIIAQERLTSPGDLAQLTQALIGRKPRNRITLFMKLWNRLDFYHRGYIKVQDLLNNFHSDRHPHVNQMRGFKQRADSEFLSREFRKSLEVFDKIKGFLVKEQVYGVDRIGPGKLSEREFTQFCWFLSFEIDYDTEFERMFYDVFKLK